MYNYVISIHYWVASYIYWTRIMVVSCVTKKNSPHNNPCRVYSHMATSHKSWKTKLVAILASYLLNLFYEVLVIYEYLLGEKFKFMLELVFVFYLRVRYSTTPMQHRTHTLK